VLEQTRAIYASGDAGRTPATYCRMSKESTQGLGAGDHRHTAPTLLSVGAQKGIHIFQRNIVETTILLAQPAQELLHMPALIPNGGRGQTALVSPTSGKIGEPVGERYDLGFGHFQTSQEVKPVLGRLNEEFSRPPQAVHTLTLVLLTSPAIGGRLDD
jgi:hypothetical protein